MKPGDEVLSVRLGDHLVLARPGRQRGGALILLNPMAAWVWQGQRDGLNQADMAEILASRFHLTLAQAQADVAQVLAVWEEVLGTGATATTWRLRLADRSVALRVEDPEMAATLARITRHLWDAPTGHTNGTQREMTTIQTQGAGQTAGCLDLLGSARDWQLYWDGVVFRSGDTADDAIASALSHLISIGCATPERLVVLHAAGVSRGGRGLLLIGRGGIGKTTLSAALNASGWDLLGDDVIPVTLDGQLLGLGLGPCLKAGSWPVLVPWLPELMQSPVIHRLGQAVRFPPPPGPIAFGPLPTTAFVVPNFQPGAPPALTPLSPVEVLQAIISAEA